MPSGLPVSIGGNAGVLVAAGELGGAVLIGGVVLLGGGVAGAVLLGGGVVVLLDAGAVVEVGAAGCDTHDCVVIG